MQLIHALDLQILIFAGKGTEQNVIARAQIGLDSSH